LLQHVQLQNKVTATADPDIAKSAADIAKSAADIAKEAAHIVGELIPNNTACNDTSHNASNDTSHNASNGTNGTNETKDAQAIGCTNLLQVFETELNATIGAGAHQLSIFIEAIEAANKTIQEALTTTGQDGIRNQLGINLNKALSIISTYLEVVDDANKFVTGISKNLDSQAAKQLMRFNMTLASGIKTLEAFPEELGQVFKKLSSDITKALLPADLPLDAHKAIVETFASIQSAAVQTAQKIVNAAQEGLGDIHSASKKLCIEAADDNGWQYSGASAKISSLGFLALAAITMFPLAL